MDTSELSKQEKKIYELGYRDGYLVGKKAGFKESKEEICLRFRKIIESD